MIATVADGGSRELPSGDDRSRQTGVVVLRPRRATRWARRQAVCDLAECCGRDQGHGGLDDCGADRQAINAATFSHLVFVRAAPGGI